MRSTLVRTVAIEMRLWVCLFLFSAENFYSLPNESLQGATPEALKFWTERFLSQFRPYYRTKWGLASDINESGLCLCSYYWKTQNCLSNHIDWAMLRHQNSPLKVQGRSLNVIFMRKGLTCESTGRLPCFWTGTFCTRRPKCKQIFL